MMMRPCRRVSTGGNRAALEAYQQSQIRGLQCRHVPHLSFLSLAYQQRSNTRPIASRGRLGLRHCFYDEFFSFKWKGDFRDRKWSTQLLKIDFGDGLALRIPISEWETSKIEMSNLEMALIEAVACVEKEVKANGKTKRKLSRQLLQV